MDEYQIRIRLILASFTLGFIVGAVVINMVGF